MDHVFAVMENMWLDPATVLLRNLNCTHTYGESLERVRSEQGVVRKGFREAEPPGASRLLWGKE